MRFGETGDIWMIPLEGMSDVEYDGSNPQTSGFTLFAVRRYMRGLSLSGFLAISVDQAGRIVSSLPVSGIMAAICGDCRETSCQNLLGVKCWRDEDDKNPSWFVFKGERVSGGINRVFLKQSSTPHCLIITSNYPQYYSVVVVNGATSGSFDLPAPDVSFRDTKILSIWLVDGGTAGPIYRGVSGRITFTANTATFNVKVKKESSLFKDTPEDELYSLRGEK